LRKFIEGKEKAEIIFPGKVKKGKRTILNAIFGMCLLPVQSKETTETKVKVMHDDSLKYNSC
jgi:GTP-binding protein EngB required for normal cell division